MQIRAALTAAEWTIPFHDNDPMGIVWHGNYYKYFEVGRDALLARIGWPLERMTKEGFGLPVVESRCRYRHYLQHDQKIRIEASVSEWENRVIFNFEIYERESRQLMAVGSTVHAAFDMKKMEVLFYVPEALQQAIASAVPEESFKKCRASKVPS